MEPSPVFYIYTTILGVFCAITGLAVGIVIGYFIGRADRPNTLKRLKKSDHFHYERKKDKR